MADIAQEFEDVIANATVDSEVINARNSGIKGVVYPTLDARLEAAENETPGRLLGSVTVTNTKWASSAITIDVATDVFTITGHGLIDGDIVAFVPLYMLLLTVFLLGYMPLDYITS